MPGWKCCARGRGDVCVQRRAFALALLTQLAALGAGGARASEASSVVVIGPDIDLYLRTAAGRLEIRPDWSQAARDNIEAELVEQLGASGWACQFVHRRELAEGRIGQLVRLHARVADAAFGQQQRRRRGRVHARQWSLGPGAQEISRAYGGDRALFIEGAGAYASAGRNMVNAASNANAAVWATAGDVFAAATLGLRLLRGRRGPVIRVTFVDLRSGDIVWLREFTSEQDPRDPDEARAIVTALLEHAPL